MKEWKDIGLDNLCVGFEGIESTRLNELNKKNTESNNARAAEILNSIGIPFRPHFLIEPGFEKEDFTRILNYVSAHKLKSPIFPILTPIPGTQYFNEVKDKIFLSYDFFDFAHATIPTKLSPRDFYKTWIHLYYESYPLWKNLWYFLLKNIAKLSGSKSKVKRFAHLNLINLFRLRLYGMFLCFKLAIHYRHPEKTSETRDVAAQWNF
ncbi:MAG: hypothetical protein HGA37_07500 [Lentimicrobium sp.]|nr:hypothetical protein [Lentimicrobium sp.]